MGAGIPNLLSFGGTAKLTRYLGFGLNIGLIPTVKISMYGEAKLSYQEYDAYARIYPFGGGSLGRWGWVRRSRAPWRTGCPPDLRCCPKWMRERSVGSVDGPDAPIGYFYTFGSGFSLGLYAGAQVPIAPSDISFSTQTPNVPAAAQALVQPIIDDNDKKVRDTLNKIGQTPFPPREC